MRRTYLILLLFLIIAGALSGQESLTTTSRRAVSLYRDAEANLRKQDLNQAIKNLSRSLDADSRFIEAYILRGDVYNQLIPRTGSDSLMQLSVNDYLAAILIDSAFYPALFFNVAKEEFSLGKYTDALRHFRSYLAKGKDVTKTETVKYIQNCVFAIKAMKNPVNYIPYALDTNINTSSHEYVNAITADEQQLLFTRARYYWETAGASSDKENVMLANFAGDGWQQAKEVVVEGNESAKMGAACLSPDGNCLYFSMFFDEDSYGMSHSYDLYVSEKQGDKWVASANLGDKINSVAWDTQPSISSDGKTLYFVSSRKGGKGGSDIWMSRLQDNDVWGNAINLGDSVNTPGNEMSPFIHSDNQTLYFSSDYHTGMGGMDLFLSRRDANGNWTASVNLGYPINSCKNEMNLIVNAGGNTAYISSDKKGGKGGYDIYKFALDKPLQPLAVGYFKGKIFNSRTLHPLKAEFRLIDLETGKEVIISYSDKETGAFLVCLPYGKNYALNVKCKGYLFFSENFALKDSSSALHPFLKDIPLQPIDTGNSVTLRNIFFDTDTYHLKPESETELQQLVLFLKDNPTLSIAINGYTDNIGGEAYNLQLSLFRAKTVCDYLINKGIPAARLQYFGFGEKFPIASNYTPEGRALNRRTEFKVTEF